MVDTTTVLTSRVVVVLAPPVVPVVRRTARGSAVAPRRGADAAHRVRRRRRAVGPRHGRARRRRLVRPRLDDLGGARRRGHPGRRRPGAARAGDAPDGAGRLRPALRLPRGPGEPAAAHRRVRDRHDVRHVRAGRGRLRPGTPGARPGPRPRPPTGEPYDAGDPELLGWVHLALADSLAVAVRGSGGRRSTWTATSPTWRSWGSSSAPPTCRTTPPAWRRPGTTTCRSWRTPSDRRGARVPARPAAAGADPRALPGDRRGGGRDAAGRAAAAASRPTAAAGRPARVVGRAATRLLAWTSARAPPRRPPTAVDPRHAA